VEGVQGYYAKFVSGFEVSDMILGGCGGNDNCMMRYRSIMNDFLTI